MRNVFLLFSIIFLFSQCAEDASNYILHISKNDVGLNKPQEGDWLYEHKESGQTFAEYKEGNPVKPTTLRQQICLQPIGTFSSLQKKELELIQEYLSIFFQLETILLDSKTDQNIPATDKRIGTAGWEQLHAPFILDSILQNHIPDSAIVLMGISAKDLYPKPAWNFVFGLAYLKKRVGVSSLYRMQEGDLKEDNFNQSLERILKISSHEIGHMFSIKHCTYASCVMNGANHMQETDNSPMRLCSVCQQKLQHAIGYDDHKRLCELLNFLKRNKLKKEMKLLQKDS